MIKQPLAFVLLMTVPMCALATELSGTITDRTGRGAQGAEITVTCGEFRKSVFTALSGDYYVPDIPDDLDCSLVIRFRGVESEPHTFKTTSDRVRFSRRVQPHDGRLEFL